MKHRFLKYSLIVGILGILSSCQKETVLFDFDENSGAHATFQAKKIILPEITEETGSTVSIPLYRGNTKGDASIEVDIAGGEGLFTPSSEKYEFKDGENVAYIELSFDYDELTPKPTTITFSVLHGEDMALNGIDQTVVTLTKRLNWEKVGLGAYYTSFFEEGWPQDIYKATEGDYYMIPDCWVMGYDVTFFYDGKEFELYTPDFGYSYGQYGHVVLDVTKFEIIEEEGTLTLVVTVDYTLPSLSGFVLGNGSEYITFPAGFSF